VCVISEPERASTAVFIGTNVYRSVTVYTVTMLHSHSLTFAVIQHTGIACNNQTAAKPGTVTNLLPKFQYYSSKTPSLSNNKLSRDTVTLSHISLRYVLTRTMTWDPCYFSVFSHVNTTPTYPMSYRVVFT